MVMATVRATSASHAAESLDEPVGIIEEIRGFWRQFFVAAFNPYRPERHYMRGPGPAWRAKHGRGSHSG
jgi:hypothetical protein